MPPQVTRQTPAGPKRPPAATTGLLARARPVEFADDRPIKCLLYGDSGTGKTTLWSTFPQPIVALVTSGVVDPEELLSLRGLDADVTALPIDVPDQVRQVAKELPGSRYRTVVLDHVSSLQDHVLSDVLGGKDVPVQKDWGFASQQQWGAVAGQVKELIKCLLDVQGLNVVIVAQQRSFGGRDDEGAEFAAQATIGPGVLPSVARWLQPAVSYGFQTFKRQETREVITKVAGKEVKTLRPTGGVEYCLRIAPHGVIYTKVRIHKDLAPNLPEYIVDPTYDKVMAAIRGT